MLVSIKKEFQKRSYSKSNNLLVDFSKRKHTLAEILSWIIARAEITNFLTGALVHKLNVNLTQFLKKNTALGGHNKSFFSLIHELVVSLNPIYMLP